VRLIAASVLCVTVVLAGGLVTACTGAPSAKVPTPTGRSIDAPPPPSSTVASSAVATRTAALLPDPRPRLGDETVSEGLRRSTAVRSDASGLRVGVRRRWPTGPRRLRGAETGHGRLFEARRSHRRVQCRHSRSKRPNDTMAGRHRARNPVPHLRRGLLTARARPDRRRRSELRVSHRSSRAARSVRRSLSSNAHRLWRGVATR